MSICKKYFRGIFYPFKLSYWRGHTASVDRRATNGRSRGSSTISDAYEEEPTDKELGVQLKNVSKVNNGRKRTTFILSHFRL